MNWRLYREACHDAGLDERKTIMNHTPGPWKTGTGSYQDECRVEQANSHRHPQSAELGVKIESHYVICHCSEPESGQGRANARLIAAAPELLEACKTTWLYLNRVNMPFALEAREYLAKVIAKAEGHDDGNG